MDELNARMVYRKAWYTMLVIVLFVLKMVTQERLATFVHVSEDYAS